MSMTGSERSHDPLVKPFHQPRIWISRPLRGTILKIHQFSIFANQGGILG